MPGISRVQMNNPSVAGLLSIPQYRVPAVTRTKEDHQTNPFAQSNGAQGLAFKGLQQAPQLQAPVGLQQTGPAGGIDRSIFSNQGNGGSGSLHFGASQKSINIQSNPKTVGLSFMPTGALKEPINNTTGGRLNLPA